MKTEDSPSKHSLHTCCQHQFRPTLQWVSIDSLTKSKFRPIVNKGKGLGKTPNGGKGVVPN